MFFFCMFFFYNWVSIWINRYYLYDGMVVVGNYYICLCSFFYMFCYYIFLLKWKIKKKN